MKRRLFVHVGLPKAGSTSIQSLLTEWALPLEHCGVHVPVAGRAGAKHARLYRISAGRLAPDPRAWEVLKHELENCAASRFAISWEGFTFQARDCAGDLAAFATSVDVDVRIVGYVRPQYQHVESRYVEQVKSGQETRPFEAVVEEYSELGRLDYNRILAPWRKAFGQRMVVRPLDPQWMPEGLLAHFLGVIGAPGLIAEAARRPHRNRRLGVKHVEALRLIATALRAGRDPEPLQLALALRCLLWDVPALLDGDVPFAALDHGQIDALGRRFAESNGKLARDVAVDAEGVLFHAPGDDLARPVRAELSAVELQRLRRLVRDALGVDLPTSRSSPSTASSSRPGGQGDSASTVGTWFDPVVSLGLSPQRLPLGQRIRAWAATLRSQAGHFRRDFLGSRDLPAYLRRLRWELEIPCREWVRGMFG